MRGATHKRIASLIGNRFCPAESAELRFSIPRGNAMMMRSGTTNERETHISDICKVARGASQQRLYRSAKAVVSIPALANRGNGIGYCTPLLDHGCVAMLCK